MIPPMIGASSWIYWNSWNGSNSYFSITTSLLIQLQSRILPILLCGQKDLHLRQSPQHPVQIHVSFIHTSRCSPPDAPPQSPTRHEKTPIRLQTFSKQPQTTLQMPSGHPKHSSTIHDLPQLSAMLRQNPCLHSFCLDSLLFNRCFSVFSLRLRVKKRRFSVSSPHPLAVFGSSNLWLSAVICD